MEYPRTVIVENVRLKKLLEEKEDLVVRGRVVSEEIDDLEVAMAQIEEEIKQCEAKVDISDIQPEAQALTDQFNDLMQKREEVKKRIFDRMVAGVPKELGDKYDQAKKAKEALEEKRNKIALKVQQKNDKAIPLGRKAMAEYLEEEGDDFDTLRIENGEVTGTIFNHFDDHRKLYYQKHPKN